MEHTLFFHGKTKNGQRFTIAGRFIKKGVIVKTDYLNLGASICSKQDSFIKKVGRCKAEGRLAAKGTRGHLLVPVDVRKNGELKAFVDYASTFQEQKSSNFKSTFNLNGQG